METSKGGKRSGAGRKPLGLIKKSIFLYVETRLIFKFGSDEKMKEKIYEFINNYGEVEIPDTPKIFDSPTISNNFQDEPKQWQEPKRKLIRTPEQFKQLRLECETMEDWTKLADEIRNADYLSSKIKQILLN